MPLAQLPTPLERMNRLSDEWGVHLFVKRDDLTGSALSGNKVRKLEYLFAEAKAKGCDTIISCGAVTSNHARATAVAARIAGFQCRLVLAGDPPEAPTGNLQLDLLAGAEIVYISRADYSTKIDSILDEQAELLRQEGRTPYIIPSGGSNSTGLMGYVQAMEELSQQCKGEGLTPDVVCCAVGSGGTYAGIVLGAELHNFKADLLGVLVCDTIDVFTEKVNHDIAEAVMRFCLSVNSGSWPLHMVDGYIASGYARTNSEQLRFMRHVAQSEGLILDPVYTNKAFFGLFNEIRSGSIKSGSNVIFIHTGGIFGLSAFAEQMTEEWGSVINWPDTQ